MREMNQPEPLLDRLEAGESSATRRDLVRILFKRRWTMLSCFVIVTAVTAGAVAMLPATYEAQAKVLVQTEQQVTPTFFSGLAAYSDRHDWDPVNRRLENEMALIEAAPIAGRVAKELELGWNDIAHTPLTYFTKRLVDAVGPFGESLLGIPNRPPSDAETVAAFQASLGVSPGESKTAETTSNIIVVKLKSPDPERARAALDRILDLYLGFDRGLSEAAGLNARTLVAEELEAANREVAAADRVMRDFLAVTRFDPRGPEGQTRPPRRATDALVTSARDDQTVTELKSTLVALESQLTEARQIYRPESESVQRIERAMSQFEARLADEIGVNANNFARYNQLDRTLRAAETHSDQLDKRLAEIDLFLQINRQSIGNRVVIEPPLVPETSDWKARLATALLGSFMGLILAVVLAGVSEYADSTLGSKEAVRRHVGVEVLTTIPKATRSELKAAFPSGRVALTAGALASRITAGMTCSSAGQKRGRSLLVTSTRAGEGKTFTATLLATELVRLGLGHVLLVDVDDHDRKPLADTGLRYSRSLQSGNGNGPPVEANQTAAVSDPPPTTLTVLDAGNGHEVARELVGARLRGFLEREGSRFDWIIFDGRSVGERDVAALAHEVDTVVLVVEADATRRHVVQDALEALDSGDGGKVKIVLNRKRYHIPAFLYDTV